MRLITFCLFLVSFSAAVCQDPGGATEAPPAVDQALRARVNQFYSAYVTGKWRDAFAVVADDMQDTYLAASKDTYDRCETVKITYSENFTKATAHESCHGEYRWHNSHIPATIPLTSTWKVVDGQWYWYWVKPTEVDTPWGVSKVSPDSPRTPGSSDVDVKIESVIKDPVAMAKAILSQVKADKAEIKLLGYQTSKDELHVTNGMSGTIIVRVNCPPLPGFHVKEVETKVGANQTATIAFEYDADEATKICGECSKLPKPRLNAQVRIEPTAQVFPLKIVFGIPPEVEKRLPKELRPSGPKQ